MSTEIIIKDNNINNNEQNKTFIPISPIKDDMMSIKCLCYYFWEEEGIYSEDFYESILDQNLSLIYKDEEEELIALCLALYEEKLKKVNISVLCVKSEYQKKGIGKSLLNACIDNCVKKGYYDFYLHVAVTNERAIKLYEKVGFEQKELIKNYYSNDPPPDNDAFLMELTKKTNGINDDNNKLIKSEIINNEKSKLNCCMNFDDNYKKINDGNDNNTCLCIIFALIIFIGIIIGIEFIIIFIDSFL